MEEFGDVKSWLISTFNICVSEDWLSACLEFIQQETNSSLSSSAHMRSLVFEQWLSSDLSEIGQPSLPAGISDTKKVDLVSSFPLQLLSIVDIGFPLFGQRQKLLKRENVNVHVSADKPFQPAWEPKPCRMLMMKLTDGHQFIEAVEYQQIRALTTDLPAGTKISVSGPLLCRRGVMLLCEDNVRILGGEVDALVETTTPISNLEGMMERNRLDEGKSSSVKLSGKFITRGKFTDEKTGLKFKGSVKEEASSWPTKMVTDCRRGGKSSTLHFKSETKSEYESFSENKKDIMNLKCEDDKDFQQWEDDDIDYDALFDDAMNSMDDVPASKPPPSTSSSATVLPQDSQRQSWNRQVHKDNPMTSTHPTITPPPSKVKSEYRSSAINPSNVPLTKCLPGKVEEPYFDDDIEAFELDDFDESFSPNVVKAPKLEHSASVKKNVSCQNVVASTDQKKDRKSSLVLKQQPMITTSHSRHNSSPSTPLSHHSNRVKHEQPRSTSFQTDYDTASNKTMSSVSNFQKSMPQTFKKEVTSSFPSKHSISGAPLPKKAKQSKIYEWGIRSSNKETNETSAFHPEVENSGTPSLASSGCFSNKTNSRLSITASASNHAVANSGDGAMDVDKDAVIVSSQSTTSSVDFSTPNGKDQPKAVIHPFMGSGRKPQEALPTRPFQYLNDLDTYQPGEIVIVKAYISTLMDKLGCSGGQAWTLSCRINDGTACLDVDLDSQVLTELIGFTAQDSIAMRQKIKSDPSLKSILMKGLTQCQNKLINISCLMEIVTPSLGSKPIVKRFIPITSTHVQQIRQRAASIKHQQFLNCT